MALTRRSLLAGTAGALALAASGFAPGPATAATGRRRAGMPSPDEVWRWQHELVGFGTRYTGSAGHKAFVDWLDDQFRQIPGFRLHRDRHLFHRWLAGRYSLAVSADGTPDSARPVPVTYYYPYSGTTSRAGVSGPLVDLGTYAPAVPGTTGTGYTPEFWLPAKGGIALVRTGPSNFPLPLGQTATGGYERSASSAQAAADYTRWGATLANPAMQGIFEAVPLLDARNAGVRGVVCVWTGMPDEEVANQYNPFITPYANLKGVPVPGDPGCPALWVGDGTGAALAKAAAGGQATARLVLTADITSQAATETLWGVLPATSRTDENLIVNTHTDGPNATEENGALGMLALARHFAGRATRRRNLYFAMVTGHFQLPQFTRSIPGARAEVGSDATSVWMTDHPQIYRQALAGITVEHLGCTMWDNSADPTVWAPTGSFDWSATYTCQRAGSTNPANFEQQAYLAAVARVNRRGWPDCPVATVLPGAVPVYLGEGAPLYAGGLGTVSLIPAPTYLLQAGDPRRPKLLDLDKLDKRLIYAQILSLAHTITAMDAAPASVF